MIESFGIASAFVSLAGFVPYIISILKGRTKPQRASWWIWSLLTVIALVIQIDQGATWSILLTFAFLFANILIAVLSLKYGFGKFKTGDLVSILISVIGLFLWLLTGNTIIALLLIISIDFLGNLLTIQKVWKRPKTENLTAWVLLSVGSILGLVSVGNPFTGKAIFPAYEAIINSAMPLIIIGRRRHKS